MKFYLIALLVSVLLLTSCIHSRYYRRVGKNIDDFEAGVTHLKQYNFTSDNDCIYLETGDSISKVLMAKYQLKRICVYDTIITFHRNYNPIFGKADVIFCDFGKSSMRNRLEAGVRSKYEKLKPINSSFIYTLYSKPAFGY